MILCGGKRREIDCAVPRDKPVVAVNVRAGVGEDRAKLIRNSPRSLRRRRNEALSISSLFIS